MNSLSRRTFLKLSAILALLPLPLALPAGKAAAFKIRMLQNCQILGYFNTSSGESLPIHDWPADSVYSVPGEIDEDWAGVLLEKDLAERVLT